MAKTNQFKIDATRPFYAVVGVGDLAVEYARTTATDVQARFSKVELEPKALRDQARTVVVSRVDELAEGAKGAQAKFEARAADFQSDAKKLPAKVESFVNETVAEATETYEDLAARGKDLVARIRRQQATQDAKAAANTTAAKAKTAKTQTSNSAQGSGTAVKNSAQNAAKTGTAAAKNTGSTAKRNVKATSTSAKKTASATTRATTDAASKVGN